MDRLRQIWRNIKRLNKKQQTIVILFLVAVMATWLAVCMILASALVG